MSENMLHERWFMNQFIGPMVEKSLREIYFHRYCPMYTYIPQYRYKIDIPICWLLSSWIIWALSNNNDSESFRVPNFCWSKPLYYIQNQKLAGLPDKKRFCNSNELNTIPPLKIEVNLFSFKFNIIVGFFKSFFLLLNSITVLSTSLEIVFNNG